MGRGRPVPQEIDYGGRVAREAKALAPSACSFELAALPSVRDEKRLLHAMGFETANIHLGTSKARTRIARDLGKRKPGWLPAAVHTMAKAVQADWQAWCKR